MQSEWTILHLQQEMTNKEKKQKNSMQEAVVADPSLSACVPTPFTLCTVHQTLPIAACLMPLQLPASLLYWDVKLSRTAHSEQNRTN